jgi:hypothetical protein
MASSMLYSVNCLIPGYVNDLVACASVRLLVVFILLEDGSGHILHILIYFNLTLYENMSSRKHDIKFVPCVGSVENANLLNLGLARSVQYCR